MRELLNIGETRLYPEINKYFGDMLSDIIDELGATNYFNMYYGPFYETLGSYFYLVESTEDYAMLPLDMAEFIGDDIIENYQYIFFANNDAGGDVYIVPLKLLAE